MLSCKILKLGDFDRSDSTITITIRRLFKDKEQEQYYGRFKEWRAMEYVIRNNEFVKTKDELLDNGIHWRE